MIDSSDAHEQDKAEITMPSSTVPADTKSVAAKATARAREIAEPETRVGPPLTPDYPRYRSSHRDGSGCLKSIRMRQSTTAAERMWRTSLPSRGRASGACGAPLRRARAEPADRAASNGYWR
jgi:hypothetical protein